MYLDNKYTIVYNSIISRAKTRALGSYTELHHIIPKSLGGSNSKENLVRLTAREHFICHLLLVKMTEGKSKFKMMKAAAMLAVSNKTQSRHKINARTYEILKRNASVAMSNLTKGKPKHTAHSKKLIADSKRGKSNGNKGVPKTDELKRIVSIAQSKPCISPLGERFSSTKEAGKAYNVSSVAIRGRIERGLTGWRYERKNDQQLVESKRKPKIKREYKPQSSEHIQKRVESRKSNGHYKDRESTIERMSKSAKLRFTK